MKRLLSLIAAVLAAASFLSVAVSAALFDAHAAERRTEHSLDFSTPYSPRAYISPSDLLSRLLGAGISGAEAEYADGYFEEYLSYSCALPDSAVSIEENSEGLTLTARVYSYTAHNGQAVTYIPAYAMRGQTKYELSEANGEYTATIAEGEGGVTVYYNGYLPLPLSTVNQLLNFTYNEATDALSAAEYLADYNRALNEYNVYLTALEKYERDRGEYESYLSAKALYDKALADYNKNQEDIKSYPQRLAKYEEYKNAYSKYTAEMEIYKRDYAVYEKAAAEYHAYITALSAIRSSMNPMESLFVKPQATGTLFNALQNGELVVMFEKYQGLLVSSFGVKESDIVYMRKYSDELNVYLRAYAEAREISEEAAFDYYKKNYRAISTLFNSLYDKMNLIITPTIFNLICGKLELEYGKELGEYKKWRVKNVLCHIYLICLCLDDGRMADGAWQFYEDDGDPRAYYFSELLEQSLIITDTNASSPAELGWVNAVELPEPPVLPVAPDVVECPIEPMEMPKPQEPQAVSKPTQPDAVDKPVLPEDLDGELLQRAGDIVELIDGDAPTLTKRAELTEAPTLMVEIAVEKSADLSGGITVYGRDGKIIKTVSHVAELPEVAPEYSDGRMTYRFYGWSLSPIELIPMSRSSYEGISVYPIYTCESSEYTVTFSVNGVESSKKYLVGELPDSGGIATEKPSDAMYDYTFMGWDKAIRRVNGDVTYTAVYSSSDRIFNISFVMADKTLTLPYVRGSEITDPPKPPVSYIEGADLYELTGWDKPFVAVTEDTVYTATYKKTALAEAEGEALSVTEGLTEYILSGKGAVFTVSELLSLAKKNSKGVSIDFEDGAALLTLSVSAVSSLCESGAENAVLICDGEGVGFIFTDKDGNIVNPTGGVRLSLAHGFDSDEGVYVRAYYKNGLYTDSVAVSCEDGRCHLTPTPEVRYKAGRRFKLTVKSGEMGNAFCDKSLFNEGESIDLHIYPNSQYRIGRIILTDLSTGRSQELTGADGLLMPAYNAELSVEFAPIIYSITFEYEGKTDTYSYRLGEQPTVPQITLSFVKDGYIYTFTGWSSPVSIVSGDAVYRAKYYSEIYVERAEEATSAWGTIFKRYVLPTVAVTVGVGAVAAGVACIIKKKKKQEEP